MFIQYICNIKNKKEHYMHKQEAHLWRQGLIGLVLPHPHQLRLQSCTLLPQRHDLRLRRRLLGQEVLCVPPGLRQVFLRLRQLGALPIVHRLAVGVVLHKKNVGRDPPIFQSQKNRLATHWKMIW